MLQLWMAKCQDDRAPGESLHKPSLSSKQHYILLNGPVIMQDLHASSNAMQHVSCGMQRAREIVKISLGAQAVNDLLGGGLESRCITEIYGEFRCCHM